MPNSHPLFLVFEGGDVFSFATTQHLAAFADVYDIDKGFEFFDSQARPLAVHREGRELSVRSDPEAVPSTGRMSELLRAYFQRLPEKYHGYALRASGAATLDELVELFVEFEKKPSPRGTWNKTVARLRR